MRWMYEFQVDIRLDGKYYCRIYLHGVPASIASTDDFIEEEDAIKAAEALIQEYQAKADEL